jgi:PKD repeat protein
VQHPTHAYTAVGAYNVTLLITDSLGYTATRTVANAVTVAAGCTPLTSADFTYVPLQPLIHSTVTFTATSTPVSATQPITHAWNFGDGNTTSQSTPTVSHAYQITGTHTVTLTVSNACTIPGLTISHAITIQPYRVYLPLIVRNP